MSRRGHEAGRLETEETATVTGRPLTIPVAPPAEPGEEAPRRPFPNPLEPLARGLAQTGEMLWLLLVVTRSAVLHPRGYWGDVRDEMYSILRLCWVPMVISTFCFGFGAPGLQALNFFAIFGIPERLGSFFIMASVREFAPWINAMVVAGVVGTAITADLGARRIREVALVADRRVVAQAPLARLVRSTDPDIRSVLSWVSP